METVEVAWSGSLSVVVADVVGRLEAKVRELTVRKVNCESRDAVLVNEVEIAESAASVMVDSELNVFDAEELTTEGKEIMTEDEPEPLTDPLTLEGVTDTVITWEPETVLISEIVILGPDGETL